MSVDIQLQQKILKSFLESDILTPSDFLTGIASVKNPTVKQAWYIQKAVAEVMGEPVPAYPSVVNTGNANTYYNNTNRANNDLAIATDKLFEMFKNAAKKLKKPRVNIQTATGLPVRFTYDTRYNKVWVTEKGYGSHRYGCIVDNKFIHDFRFNANRNNYNDIMDAVKDFAADPMGMVIKFGKITGVCSFCSLPLKDQKSLDVGYGPICAEHFHLPWGKNSFALNPSVSPVGEIEGTVFYVKA